MDKAAPLTMKDIAREFGISVATVSRALKDSPHISKERREVIQQYAREHNFYPNLLAGSLRQSRELAPKIIGVIIPQIAHYYFSTILAGIEEQAYIRGYDIMVTQSGEKYEMERRICENFARHRVCGVIVSQAKDTCRFDHFELLQQCGIPLVFYDRICTGMNTNRVVVDDYMGAFTAVTHLIETGCKRIAFFGSQMNLEISKNRYNGYKDALAKHGLPFDKQLVYFCDNREMAEELTPEVMAGDNRPDAFFAVNDDTAIGILHTVKRLGYQVPEECAICGFTNGERAIATDPMLTTVEQRGHKVGEEAVNILVDQLEGKLPKDKVQKRIVRTRLIIRGTTK